MLVFIIILSQGIIFNKFKQIIVSAPSNEMKYHQILSNTFEMKVVRASQC